MSPSPSSSMQYISLSKKSIFQILVKKKRGKYLKCIFLSSFLTFSVYLAQNNGAAAFMQIFVLNLFPRKRNLSVVAIIKK